MIDRADNFIRSLGVEAYRVGGSVRDEILGRRSKDADYMIRGIDLGDLGTLLEQQGRSFQVSPLKLRDGRQAGWRVFRKGMGLVEIALPRTEVSTGPGHRDFAIKVDPAVTVEEDALRRDFTFNALYKIVHNGRTSRVALPNGTVAEDIIDPLGGLDDLMRRRVKTTHATSFRDDPLRTLRALRFVSVLGYDLETFTTHQMIRHAHAVDGLTAGGYASGTVFQEMSKMLMGDNVAQALRLARNTGVLETLFPELLPMLGFEQASRYHDMTTDEHTFAALDMAARVDAPLRVRWALLFHDSGKPATAWVGDDGRKHYYKRPTVFEKGQTPPQINEDHEVVGEQIWRGVAARLTGVPRDLREDVATLIRNHMVGVEGRLRPAKVRRARVLFGDDLLRDLYMHRACDISGKGVPNKAHLERLAALEKVRRDEQAAGTPSSVKDLAVGGRDVMAHGVKGADIGWVLGQVLDDVVTQPTAIRLTREWQMDDIERVIRGL